MEIIKTSPNVEFHVTYGDGTCHHAPEGVLFEAKGDKMIMHLGTSRIEVLFAVAECLSTAIEEAGLRDAFIRYIDQAFDDAKEVNPDA